MTFEEFLSNKYGTNSSNTSSSSGGSNGSSTGKPTTKKTAAGGTFEDFLNKKYGLNQPTTETPAPPATSTTVSDVSEILANPVYTPPKSTDTQSYLNQARTDWTKRANDAIMGTAGGTDVARANKVADFLAGIPVQSTENFLPTNMQAWSDAYQPLADAITAQRPENRPLTSTDNFLPTNMEAVSNAYQAAVDKSIADNQARAAELKAEYDAAPQKIADLQTQIDAVDNDIAEASRRLETALFPDDIDAINAELTALGEQKTDLIRQRDEAEAAQKENPFSPEYRSPAQKEQTAKEQEELDALVKEGGHRKEVMEMLRANPDLEAPASFRLPMALAGTLQQGLTGIANFGAGALDMSGLGDLIDEAVTMFTGYELHPMQDWTDQIRKENQMSADYYANATRGGVLSEGINEVGPQIFQALPALALAMYTGGASMYGTSLADAAAIAQMSGAQQSLALVGEGVKTMSARPDFILSFLQESGNSYNEGIEKGMTETEASVYAMLYGYLAAAVEVGGTTENLGGMQQYFAEMKEAGPATVKEHLINRAKEIVSEIGEENVQGMLERGTQSFFGVDTALYSNDPDQNAIIKPKEMLEEAKVSGIIAGLFGIPGDIQAGRSIRANQQTNTRTNTQTNQTEATPTAEDIAENVSAPTFTLPPTSAVPPVNTESIAEVPSGAPIEAPSDISSESSITVEENSAEGSGGINTPPATETLENSNVGSEISEENATEDTYRERGESRSIRTDEARAEELRQFKEQNPDMYKVVKNEATLQKALDIFNEQGVEGSAATLEQALADARNGKKLPLEMVPLHKLVCDALAKAGQVERANRISADLGAELTYAGQLGQANIILRNSSATAKAEAFAKTVERLISENNANVPEEAVQDLLDRYRAAETDEARDAIIDDAVTAIAQSSPTTLREAITAIRYLNMLGNFKTQGRNILGNTGMLIATRVKNRVLALEQMAVNAVSNLIGKGDAVTQTNTLTTSGKMFGEAWRMFAEDQSEAFGEGKYSDVARGNKAIQDKKTIFKWNWKTDADTQAETILRKIADAPLKVLEAYRKATSWAMEKGDVIFQRVTYAQALADYAKAQGYESLADVPAEELQAMREHAIKEAQEATFHDDNAVSNFFSNFDKNWGKGRVVSQGVVPFRKTPANVGVAMWKYSPLGLINTFVDAAKAVQGTGDVNTVLNSAAKSLTGSALTALGYILAKNGLARGKEDDDKLASYEKNVQGLGDYSIVMPDGTTVSLDWLQPESAAFFVGVEAAKYFDDGVQADDFMSLLGSTSDIALNMSFLSGLSDSLEDIAKLNGDKQAVIAYLTNSLFSYGGQIITNSLLGQAEQASEEYRQTTYTDPDSFLPTAVQKQLAKISGKTPGVDFQQTDYIDAWGRKQDNGSVAGRIAESFFSPAYINENRSTEVDDELKRLHGAVGSEIDGSVFPTTPNRSTEINGVRLSPEEYEIYATTGGQKALELVTDFVNSPSYADLDDKTKAETIKKLYTFARNDAQNAVLAARGEEPVTNSDYEKAKAVMEAGGMSMGEYFSAKGSLGSSQESTAAYLFNSGMDPEKAEAVYNVYYPNAKHPYSEFSEKFETVKNSGYTEEEYDALGATIDEAKAGKEPWDSAGDSAVLDAITEAVGKGLSDDAATSLIIENTSKNYKNPFSALIDDGHSMQEAMDILDLIDQPGKDGSPGNRSIEQSELIAYYKAHPEEEPLVSLLWDVMGYTGKNTKDWETFAANGYKK